tara:strand:- start:23 stop:967 length:945 start_codon:yes stop_codon:yes gene_type:complete
MSKLLLKYILPNKIINLILKIYIKASIKFSPFKTSESFWNANTVDTPKKGFKNIKDSQNHLRWRNDQYISSEQNMRFKNTHKKIVLDYGCGPGNGLINIVNNAKPKKLFAVDVSQKAIYLAKKRAKLHHLDVNFIKINENEEIKQIRDNSIDVIKCDGVLHHIKNIQFVLKEFYRILKKNGVINLMVYNRDSLWFHLHVSYELMISRRIFENLPENEVFRMSTDGFQCPVSVCFKPNEFIKICRNNKFYSKLSNVSISKFELGKIKLLTEAVNSGKLKKENKEFLKKITFDKNNIPYFHKNIAGINAYYELKKL